jgi:glycosyltransferase involved in cell wall biosynthesis
MSRPKVSVIVPVFDAERYLREALYSVARQRFTDHEVIVIDDGSTTDACEQIVAAAGKETGHRMRYVRQDNRGPAVARNRGLAEAKGELIAFLDSDDVYAPDKLALQVEIMRRVSPDCAFVTGGYERFVEGAPAETNVVLPAAFEGTIYPALLHSRRAIPWVPAAHLFRRAALAAAGGYDAALRYGEDKELVIRLARTSKVLTHRDVVFRYRVHTRSLSLSLGEPRLLADVDYLVRSLCAADPRLPHRLIRQMRRETLFSAATLVLRHTGNHARFTGLVRAAIRTGGVGASWRIWRAVGAGYAALAMQRLRRPVTHC